MDTLITDYLVREDQLWIEKNNNFKYFHLCSISDFIKWVVELHENHKKTPAIDVLQLFLHLENVQKFYELEHQAVA